MGIQKVAAGVTVTYSEGCNIACTDSSKFSDAVNTAKNADVVVMVIGLDESQERFDIHIHICHTIYMYSCV